MTQNSTFEPVVSLILPVYNGSNYIREAIDSILNQTFSCFELIICDNASQDETSFICRQYESKDSRIFYHRNETNIGAAPNFNLGYTMAKGKYIKWAAHDDVLSPEYLSQCVSILEQNQLLAMSHGQTITIDSQGRELKRVEARKYGLNDISPQRRLGKVIWVDYFTEIFGLIRAEVLGKTKLYPSFVGSDRNLLAEILLHGDIGYTDDYLFLHRMHPESYTTMRSESASKSVVNNTSSLQWFDPKVNSKLAFMTPQVKTIEYLKSIYRSPLGPSERFACTSIVMEWAFVRTFESLSRSGQQYRQKYRDKYFKPV